MKNSNKFQKLDPSQIAEFKKKMQAKYPEDDEAAASKYLKMTKKQRDEDEDEDEDASVTDAPVWIDGKI
jgi:Ni,Fe-hydrogenase I large subunit